MNESALRRTHLFGDLRPFAQCHAPTLVARPDGRIRVAFFAGTFESHADVGIWSTTGSIGADDASRFEPPRRIARVGDAPHWNPVLFALDDTGDRLVLHFKVGASIRRWQTFQQSSEDGGASWSEARPLVPGDRGGRGAVRTKPMRLASGDWLAGASLEAPRRWTSFFDRSPDGIGGWQATPAVPMDARAGKGLIQPALWASRPGRVHALFRSAVGRIFRSDSEDDGRSWSCAAPTDLPNNNSGLDVVRLGDGRLVLACNPVGRNRGARTPLSLLVSRDEGATWPGRIDLETGPGEFSYPAIVPFRDGVAVAWTWNRRRIAVAQVPAEALSCAEPPAPRDDDPGPGDPPGRSTPGECEGAPA
ncbi:MAG: sialidase family protein [Myxococcota bacterium]|nr:exo-alpha-sialidase [Myxococcales bacterium]